MKLIHCICFIFLLLTNSCHYKKPPSIAFEKFNFPTLIDTLNLNPSDRNENWLATSTYEVLYIGIQKDTINVDYRLPTKIYGFSSSLSDSSTYNLENSKHLYREYFLDWQDERFFRYWDEAAIEIQIDTTEIIKNEDSLADPENRFFKAYPVILTNHEIDTLCIGSGDYLPLVMEAKDSTGTWNSIVEEWFYDCGVGIGAIILPPKQIALTSALIYHGNYKTDLRLRLGENYSSTFKGSINYQQFESIFTEDGYYSQRYLDSKKE